MDDVRPPLPDPGTEPAEQRSRRRIRPRPPGDPERLKEWKDAHRETIEAINRWDEQHELFTDRFRPI